MFRPLKSNQLNLRAFGGCLHILADASAANLKKDQYVHYISHVKGLTFEIVHFVEYEGKWVGAGPSDQSSSILLALRYHIW